MIVKGTKEKRREEKALRNRRQKNVQEISKTKANEKRRGKDEAEQTNSQ
jgi:hypothetical protein